MIPIKIRLGSYSIGFALFVFACFVHIELLQFLKSDVMLGDTGDGYFNLWVLEKTYQRLTALDIQSGLSGHIFWPHHQRTLFWSDNHLIYAPAYALLRSVCGSMVGAFSSLTYLLCLLGYVANFFLYHSVFQIFKETKPQLSIYTYLFVPIFSYWSHFSETKIRYFMHWQNLSYFWLLLIIAACMNLSYHIMKPNKERTYFCLIAFAQSALFLSTPYFAVLGCLLILAWAIPYFRYSHRKFIELIKKSAFTLIPTLGASLSVVVIYASNQKQVFAWSYIHSLGVRIQHHFVPRAGIAYEFIRSGPWQMPEISHESSAYLGFGILATLGLITTVGLGEILRDTKLRVYWGKRTLALLLILLSLRLLIELNRNFAAYAITALLAGAGSVLIFRAQNPKQKRFSGPILYLLSVLLIANSLAMGPLKSFLNQSVNPSFWWIFRTLVPPVESMRAIGRLAGVGQSIACALSLVFLLFKFISPRSQQRKVWIAIALVLSALQIADPLGSKAFTFKPNVAALSPTAQTKSFLDGLQSPGVAFPSGPFHANPETMIYFSSLLNINLLNGYSAHSSPEWDLVMELGRGRNEPTQDQIDLAKSLGAQWAMIFKAKIGVARSKELKAEGYLAIYEDEQTVFFDIMR